MSGRQLDLPRLDRTPCTPDQLRTAHMVVSVLLDYPGDAFDEALEAASASAAGLPGALRDDVAAFVG